MEYSVLSKELTQKISKNIKKCEGIFFTPPSCIHYNIDKLSPYIDKFVNVLEPACGSGEYINALSSRFPQLKITGIELNNTIYHSIKQLSNNNNINIENIDYLTYNSTTKYDLIIGNPPFFVMKKSSVDQKYHPYFDGRPNIFILFIIKSLTLLNKDGILSFVLPKNFLNCLYYEKTRAYIYENYRILDIIECNDKYLDTQQDTIILIIQNTCDEYDINSNYTINVHNYTIFGLPNHIDEINKLYKDSKSLFELGFKVKVGSIVWNDCKDILVNDKSKTRLIYSSDIVNNNVVLKTYKNKDKKNYINKDGITNPTLVINRGYGIGEYKFEYCILTGEYEYLIENHLIYINYNGDIDNTSLLHKYHTIIKSLNNDKTKKFISYYFGNSAINTTEMNHILPIYFEDESED